MFSTNNPSQQQEQKHLDRRQQAMMAFLEDDDSDIEIVGGPSKRGYELASPEQARHPSQFWKSSPKRKTTITHRDLNKRLQSMMMEDMAKIRKEYEEKALAHGNYLTPEERAKKHMEQEKEAKAIDLQVKQHFLKENQPQKSSNNPGSSSKDAADIIPGEDEVGPLVYSGDEEEYDEDGELDDDEDDDEDDNDEDEEEKEEEHDDNDSEKNSLDGTKALKQHNGVDEDEMMLDQNDTAAGTEADKEVTSLGVEERKRKRNNAILLDDDDEGEDQSGSDEEKDRAKKLKEGLSLSDFLKGSTKNDTPLTMVRPKKNLLAIVGQPR